MASSLAVISLATVILFLGANANLDCEVGSKWTKNFIRFECYSEGGAKGFRGYGCSTTANGVGGKNLKAGDTHDEKYFRYRCEKKGNEMAYTIINCIATDGKLMDAGTTHKQKDGVTLECYKKEDGSIALKRKTESETTSEASCIYKGKSYKALEKWEIPVKNEMQSALIMRCSRGSKSGEWVAKAFGCKCTCNVIVPAGGHKKLFGELYECKRSGEQYALEKVIHDGLLCSVPKSNKTVKVGESADHNGVRYTCRYYQGKATLRVGGCVVDGKLIYQRRVTKVGERYAYCGYGGHIVYIEEAYCTDEEGTKRELESRWDVADVVYACAYNSFSKSVELKVLGCRFNKQLIGLNSFVGFRQKGKTDYYVCDYMGDSYKARLMTFEEKVRWGLAQKVKHGNEEEFTGNGGSGSGGERILTTTTPVPTTTTKQPTTTTTTTKAPTITTQTPTTTTMTTKAPTTTTQAPTTTTTTTKAPTTTTQAPTTVTTTTTKAPTTTTEAPTTTTELPTTTTDATTTSELLTTVTEVLTTTTTEPPTTTTEIPTTTTEEPTTTTVAPTTTTEAPTTITTTTTELPTTVTEIPTTVVPTTEPVTEPPTTIEVLTTTTELPTTVATAPPTTTELLTTTESPTTLAATMTITAETTTAVTATPCEDMHRMCAVLKHLCHCDNNEQKVLVALQRKGLTTAEVELILSMNGYEEEEEEEEEDVEESEECSRQKRSCEELSRHSSEEESHECHRSHRSRCGHCKCGKASDECRCGRQRHHRHRKGCKGCKSTKHRLQTLVTAMCPRTCGACDMQMNMASAAKELVQALHKRR